MSPQQQVDRLLNPLRVLKRTVIRRDVLERIVDRLLNPLRVLKPRPTLQQRAQ